MRWLLWLMFLPVTVVAANVSGAPEYSIKAGYILLFTRYVEWPQSAFATAKAPIQICVLGTDPFGPVLDQTLAGQQSQRRPLSLRRIADPHAADGCHVLFIGTAAMEQTKQWLAAVSRQPVLTISDHSEALEYGAILGFVSEVEDGRARIRFEANLPSMQRAGLSASSQMLVAARKVHRDDPGI
ncbi:MAG TPA: YfiR family protein [Steroidobacter sp.]|uniref:YfiR family protein n=1 Tax=Steroidobacter sp. TaxID=1978227 RepID=UPI002ED7D8AB